MPTPTGYQTFDAWCSHPPQFENDFDRIANRDIARLDDGVIRDEIAALVSERARRATIRRLDRDGRRMVRLWMLDDNPTDLEWMQARIERLKAELQRRQRRAA